MRIKRVDRRKKRREPKNIYLVADSVNIISKGGINQPIGYGSMGGVSGGGKRQYHFGFDPALPPASVTGAPGTVEPKPISPSQNLIQNSLGRIGTLLGSAALSYASQAFLNNASGWGGSDTFNNGTSPNVTDASTSTVAPQSISTGVGNDVEYGFGDTPGTVVRVDKGIQANPPFASVSQGTSMGGFGPGVSMGTQTMAGPSMMDFGMQAGMAGPSMMDFGMQAGMAGPSMKNFGMQAGMLPSVVSSGMQTSSKKGKSFGTQAGGMGLDMETQAGGMGLDIGTQAGAMTSSMGTQMGRPPIPTRPISTMTERSTPISTNPGTNVGIQAVDPKLSRTVGTQAAMIEQAGTTGMAPPITTSVSTQAVDPQIASMKKELENYHERLLTTGADASTVLALNGALSEMLQEAQADNSNSQRVLANTLSYLETFLDQVVGDPRWRDLLDRSQSPDQQIQQIFGLVEARDPNLRAFIKKVGMFTDKLIRVEDRSTSPMSPTRPPIPMRPAYTMTDQSIPIGMETQTSPTRGVAMETQTSPKRSTAVETQTGQTIRLKPKGTVGTQTSEVIRLKKPKTTTSSETQTKEIIRLKKPKTTTSGGTQTGTFIRLKNPKRKEPETVTIPSVTPPSRRVRKTAPKPPPIRTTNLPKSAQNRTGMVPQGRAEPKSAAVKSDTVFKTTRKSARSKK